MKINNINTFLLLFISSSIFIALFGEWILIPDSYEQSIVAECWSTGTSRKINCSEIFPYFRPPIPSLLIMTLLPFMKSLSAMAVLCWFSSSFFIAGIGWSIQTFIGNQEHPHIGLLVGFGLLFSLFGTDLSLLLDSKIIVLPPVLVAMFLFQKHTLSVFQVALLAICLSAAFLTRLENLLLIVIGGGWVVWAGKRKVVSPFIYCGIVGFVIYGWMGLLWQETSEWTISPRYWEGLLVFFFDEMPLVWIKNIFGMGIWNPPLRTLALDSQLDLSLTSMADSNLSLSEWAVWFKKHILTLFHPIHLLSLIILSWMMRREEWLLPTSRGLLFISLPSIAVTFIPQGREAVFPIVYVIPLWISIWVWTTLLCGVIWSRLIHTTHQVMLLVIIALTYWMTPPINLPTNLELSEVGLATQHWLINNTPEDSLILSSFETAPIVWLADRKWQEWASPWEANQRIPSVQKNHAGVYALVWLFDTHAWYSLSFEEKYYEPTSYIHKDHVGIVIINLSDPE